MAIERQDFFLKQSEFLMTIAGARKHQRSTRYFTQRLRAVGLWEMPYKDISHLPWTVGRCRLCSLPKLDP